ncbi:ADP-ribosyl cyclase/cyclic ADP-ribose hydrolase-like isoform X2 [Apostichopus japonicus]|uniref:ADP-ribosyl cyclase/cyclic ADP-ribose hydrolase-like isoform X2 n=1 Tax=Stichopus japonicus TaxID=307972 RepID=UPI003AB31ACB
MTIYYMLVSMGTGKIGRFNGGLFVLLIFVQCCYSVAEYESLTKELFLKRCKEFDDRGGSCESLWTEFLRAFECPSTDCSYVSSHTKYENYVALMPPTTPKNKTMFFSGRTKDAAYNIGKNCVHKDTIQMTLLGHIFDEVSWCCSRNGHLDDICSQDKTCTDETAKLFWSQASHVYAENATGYTAVVLNGSSTRPPYPENSIFTNVEVPGLTSNVVSMTAILVYDMNDRGNFIQTWRCNSQGSRLSDLQVALTKKNIQYNCTDDLWFSSEECNSAIISTPFNTSLVVLMILLQQYTLWS